MIQRFHGRARRAALAAACLVLGWSGAASALIIEQGDMVGVFVKGGTEVIVNLGPADITNVPDIPPSLFAGEPFNGSLVGVKFVGLAVESPGRTVNCCGGTFPQANLIYTSTVEDPTPSDDEIENAMNKVDQSSATAETWFNLLRQLPGGASEVLATDNAVSYTLQLGLGTDAVANFFQFSTAGIIDDQGRLDIVVYEAVRGYEGAGGPPTEYNALVAVAIDGTDVTFEEAPEAGAVIGTLAGVAVLLGARSLRRRSSRSPA